jgi:recombination protein RecT
MPEDKNLPVEVKQGEVVEAKPPKTLNEIFTSEYAMAAIQKAAPKHLSAERFLRIANTAMSRVPKLMNCTVPSVWNCLIQLSTVGLEPDGRNAHLIPYENKKKKTVECTLIIDYKGIVTCVRRSGEVSDIHADIVCDNDEFEFNMGKVTKHIRDLKKPRGKMYAAYSMVVYKDGTVSYEVMSKEEIDKIRARSAAKSSGPWCTDYDEMAKKTVFRRHSKWLPFSPEVQRVIEADDASLFPDIAKDSITGDDIRGMADGSRKKIAPPAPIKDAETEDVKITQKQVEELYAKAIEIGWQKPEVEKMLHEKYNVENAADIPTEAYADVMEDIENPSGIQGDQE